MRLETYSSLAGVAFQEQHCTQEKQFRPRAWYSLFISLRHCACAVSKTTVKTGLAKTGPAILLATSTAMLFVDYLNVPFQGKLTRWRWFS